VRKLRGRDASAVVNTEHKTSQTAARTNAEVRWRRAKDEHNELSRPALKVAVVDIVAVAGPGIAATPTLTMPAVASVSVRERASVLSRSCFKEPGELDRFGKHRPMARVDVDEVEVLGLGEFGH